MRPDFKYSPLLETEAKAFLYQIGSDEYYIRGIFINPNGKTVPITKQSLMEIRIKDSIYDPFTDLSICLMDTDDAFQRTVQGEGGNKIEGFTYRGDGKDLFYLEINPIRDTKDVNNINSESNISYNNVFSLRNLYACVDEKTVVIDGYRCKEITCIDSDKKKLLEKKTQTNSTYVINQEDNEETSPTFYRDNSERSAPTGKIIRKILTDTLGRKDEDIFHNKVLTVKGEDKSVIMNFENGASNVFYTSNADMNAFDDLNYLYEIHVSDGDENAFSYLKKDYYGGKYTLLSIDEIYKKAVRSGSAGPYMIENLVITGATSVSEDKQDSTPVTPVGTASFNNKSIIVDCKFYNPSFELLRDQATTKVVHSYDHENKTFNMFKNESNMSGIKQKFKTIFVDPLGENYEPSILLSPDLDSNTNYENVYSLYGNDIITAKAFGQNKLLKNLLATNLSVELTCFGQMFRKSGRFISIDRGNNYKGNNFDNKFTGIYYILNVEHNFIGNNEYFNKIYAVKTYFNKKIDNVEGLN